MKEKEKKHETNFKIKSFNYFILWGVFDKESFMLIPIKSLKTFSTFSSSLVQIFVDALRLLLPLKIRKKENNVMKGIIM